MFDEAFILRIHTQMHSYTTDFFGVKFNNQSVNMKTKSQESRCHQTSLTGLQETEQENVDGDTQWPI